MQPEISSSSKRPAPTPNHHAARQFGTGASDALAKAHDRIAVNDGNALSCADALAGGGSQVARSVAATAVLK
jgi:hypothetical protein